jgi:hypothetical protein
VAVSSIVHPLVSLFFNLLLVNRSDVQRRLEGDSCFAPVNVYLKAVPVAFLRGREVAYFEDRPAERGAATRFKVAGAVTEEAVSDGGSYR